jgi:putative ABC transport system substrate-binding protein
MRLALLVMSVASLVLPQTSWAQAAGKIHRIGFLAYAGACRSSVPGDALNDLLKPFAKLGYAEGKNLVVECRLIEGQRERQGARELAMLNVDVIVASGTPSAIAAQGATRTIPIVMFAVADPVASGLVKNLSRPGGNITGLSILGGGLTLKSFEVLKQGVPQLSRVAILTDPGNQGQVALAAERKEAGKSLGLTFRHYEVRQPADLDRAFQGILRDLPDALYLYPLRLASADAERIIAFAEKHRLPTLGNGSSQYLRAGVLFYYGESLEERYERVASYVDRILKGADPAVLPVEQPTRFDLVVNQKTAKAIGFTVPPVLLVRASQVLH